MALPGLAVLVSVMVSKEEERTSSAFWTSSFAWRLGRKGVGGGRGEGIEQEEDRVDEKVREGGREKGVRREGGSEGERARFEYITGKSTHANHGSPTCFHFSQC